MKILSRLLIPFSLACLAMPTLAQNYDTCDRWGSWSVNGYTIFNNIWGDNHGTQCLWANNQGDWGFWANHSGGGIKSYPNVGKEVSYTVGSMPSITASFNVSRPGHGSYNTAFDIWYDNHDYEIMLWANWGGGMGPISYNWGCNGYPSSACPIRTNVNVGGHTWNLFEGTNGHATVYSFMRTSHTNSGTVDITAISKWLANNGYFRQNHNTHLHDIQFGFEVTDSAGGHEFKVNSYNVSIGSSSGGSSGGGSSSSSGGSSSGASGVVSRISGKCMDVSGQSSANGANITQYDCWGGGNQQFQWKDLGNGYHQLVAQHSGKCIRASNGDVFQYDCHNSYWTEMFERISAGSGNYILKNRSTGTCLRVANSSGSNGAEIVLASCNTGWWSQHFSFQ